MITTSALTARITERTLHFKQPADTSRGVYLTRTSFFVELTQGCARGVGECAPLPDLSCDVLSGTQQYRAKLQYFCDMLCSTGCLPTELMRNYPSMLFGLETAMLQLRAGGSHVLLDTPFARGEEGIPINGLVWMGTLEQMMARLEEKLSQGFHCIKLKIGAIDFEKELELIKRIRRQYTEQQVELRVDANGGFTPANAMQRLEMLAPYKIHSIEQPIKQHQWNEMAQICQHSPIPVALDEELIGVNTLADKQRLLQALHPQYIVLKPSLHGGMQGCDEWIRLASQLNIGNWITSALESNVGLNASAQYCAHVYGPHIAMPQGLGTGMLFTDNVPMSLQIKGEKLWCTK